jgi:hypothetical protein
MLRCTRSKGFKVKEMPNGGASGGNSSLSMVNVDNGGPSSSSARHDVAGDNNVDFITINDFVQYG